MSERMGMKTTSERIGMKMTSERIGMKTTSERIGMKDDVRENRNEVRRQREWE